MGRRKRESGDERPLEPKRIEVETFMNPFEGWRGLREEYGKYDQPSCFNGNVKVKRYRVVAELIEEPPEVLFERIRTLWRACDNFHQRRPLNEAAKALGFELDPKEYGVDRKPVETTTLIGGRKPYGA